MKMHAAHRFFRAVARKIVYVMPSHASARASLLAACTTAACLATFPASGQLTNDGRRIALTQGIVALQGRVSVYRRDASVQFCFTDHTTQQHAELYDPVSQRLPPIDGRCASLIQKGWTREKPLTPSINGSASISVFGDKSVAWINTSACTPSFGAAPAIINSNGSNKIFHLLEVSKVSRPLPRCADPGAAPTAPFEQNIRTVSLLMLVPVGRNRVVLDVQESTSSRVPVMFPRSTLISLPYPLPDNINIGPFAIVSDKLLIDPATHQTFVASAINPVDNARHSVDLTDLDNMRRRYCAAIDVASKGPAVPVIDPFENQPIGQDFALPKPPAHCPKTPNPRHAKP